MGDIIEETQHSVKVPVDGKEYTLEFLTSYDRAELMIEHRKELREKLKANLKDAEADQQQRFSELQAFDEAQVTQRDWIDYVNDIRSDYPIVLRSLGCHHAGEAAAIARKIPLTMTLKAQLCGLALVDKTPEDETDPTKGPDQPPGPQAVYGS